MYKISKKNNEMPCVHLTFFSVELIKFNLIPAVSFSRIVRGKLYFRGSFALNFLLPRSQRIILC